MKKINGTFCIEKKDITLMQNFTKKSGILSDAE